MKLFFSLFFLGIFSASFAEQMSFKKDTVQALVVSTNESDLSKKIHQLNGEEIISLIDSLLTLDIIPASFVKSLSDYAENKRLKEDVFISLSGFYDTSIYPSQSMYNSWDTYTLYPRANLMMQEGESKELILQDTVNFCNFYNPYKGLITSNFGWRDGRAHNGIDIDLQVWDPVVAAFDGMVRIARNHNGYGRVVIIRHYNGLETLYAHLHRFKVKSGDIVEAGQVIGLGGSSGRSTGSHLHFEVRYRGKPLNPKSLINFNKNVLISDSIRLIRTKWSYVVVPTGIDYHTVIRGESLFKIARKYGTTILKLCTMNGIKRNRPLRVGQKIMIDS
ncbi:MAG: peptidoglycan DD-metalloendopeptidase family protein [Flavobacteriales bacterium]|nr:peptidoglycan DD-metalloendopeptidase family protein [Flavobacteriales bacterium]